MGIVLCDTSSMEWWLHAAYCDRSGHAEKDVLDVCHPSSREASRLFSMAPWLSAPYHFLVDAESAKRKGKMFSCHTSPQTLPEGSLCRISSCDFAASPEFTLTQMARRSSLAETVRFASHLCAQFMFDRGNERLPKRAPLTAKHRIDAYAWANPRLHGTRRIRESLPYIVENAASPPEIDLAMRLSLPRRCGGYAIAPPEMNVPVPLSENAQATAGRRHVVGDLCWTRAKLVVEYDSDAEHLNPAQAEKDATKRLALSMQGFEVITVTSLMMRNVDAFEGVAERVARRLGTRLRVRGSSFRSEQEELFRLARVAPWRRR